VGSDEAESKEVEPSQLDLPLGNDMSEESVYEKIEGPEQIISALEDLTNKFIFLKHGTEKVENLNEVEGVGKIISNLNVKPFYIDASI
jgi:hypothetical protein